MRIPVMIIAAAVAIGCGPSQVEILESRIVELEKELRVVRKATASTSVTVEDLETRLFLFQDELDTYKKRSVRHHDLPVVRVRPDRGPKSRFDPSDTRPLREPEGDGAVAGYDQLTDDGRRIPGNPTEVETPSAGPRAPEPPKARKVSDDDREAVALYKASYADLQAGRVPQAVEGFTRFLEEHPNHGLADNSLYWLGECHYTRGLWRQALTTFQQVIATYPLGNKAPDAMLKMALCYYQLRDMRQYREILQQIVEIYPKSPVAQLASTRLEQSP